MALSEATILEIVKDIVLVIGGGGAAALIGGMFNKRKVRAESEGTLSNATSEFAKTLQQSLNLAQKRMDEADSLYEATKKKHRETEEQLDRTREQLEKALEQGAQLQEIVQLMKEREGKSNILIQKLIAALKMADPANPLINELSSLQVHAADDLPKA